MSLKVTWRADSKHWTEDAEKGEGDQDSEEICEFDSAAEGWAVVRRTFRVGLCREFVAVMQGCFAAAKSRRAERRQSEEFA